MLPRKYAFSSYYLSCKPKLVTLYRKNAADVICLIQFLALPHEGPFNLLNLEILQLQTRSSNLLNNCIIFPFSRSKKRNLFYHKKNLIFLHVCTALCQTMRKLPNGDWFTFSSVCSVANFLFYKNFSLILGLMGEIPWCEPHCCGQICLHLWWEVSDITWAKLRRLVPYH